MNKKNNIKNKIKNFALGAALTAIPFSNAQATENNLESRVVQPAFIEFVEPAVEVQVQDQPAYAPFKDLSLSEKAFKVYDWLVEGQADSVIINAFADNALYNKSLSAIRLNDSKPLEYITQEFDGFESEMPWGRIKLIGGNNVEFPNEVNSYKFTTFSSISNTLNLSDDEIKTMVSYNTGLKPEEIRPTRGLNEEVLTVVYLGNDNHNFVRPRRLPNGTLVRKNIIFDKNTEAVVPLEKLTKFIGYDTELVHEIKKEYGITTTAGGRPSSSALQAYEQEIQTRNETIEALTTQKQEAETKSEELSKQLDKFNVSVLGGYDFGKTGNVGLYFSGVFNNAGLGALYTFPIEKNILNETTVNEDIAEPVNGWSSFARVENSVRKDKRQHAFEVLLGYDINDKLTLFGSAGLKSGEIITNGLDIVTTGAIDPLGEYHAFPANEIPYTEVEKYNVPVFGAGAKYKIFDRFGVYGRANIDTKGKVSGSAGVYMNLRKTQNK